MISMLRVEFRDEDKNKYSITSFNDEMSYAEINPEMSDDKILKRIENRYGIPLGIMILDKYKVFRISGKDMNKVIVRPKVI